MGIFKIEKIKNLLEAIKANREKLSTYLFFGVPLVAIILLIILFQFISPGKSIKQEQSPTTDISKTPITAAGYGTLEVDSPINGAEFLFENNIYYTPSTLHGVKAGSYTILAHNEGYMDESHTVNIQNNKLLRISLNMDKASTESAIDQVEKTWVSGMQQEANQSNQNIQTIQTSNPLTQYLPQPIGSVMLDYNVSSDGSVQYVVYALPGQTYNKSDYVQQVDNFIQSVNIDPNSIQIQWQ